MKQVPQFKPRKGKALKNTLSGSSGGRTNVIKRDLSKFGIGGRPVVAFNTALENNYMSLKDADIAKNYPNAAKANIGISLIGKLAPEDKIVVKLEQKHVKAEVVEIIPQMKSAYLTFEDYPSLYDEFQPCDLIRLPSGAEIPPEDMKPGLVVIDISNSNVRICVTLLSQTRVPIITPVQIPILVISSLFLFHCFAGISCCDSINCNRAHGESETFCKSAFNDQVGIPCHDFGQICSQNQDQTAQDKGVAFRNHRH